MRVERDDVLHFITNRTVEERFWFAPLVASFCKARNRAARRCAAAFERTADKRLLSVVNEANRRRGPYQPKLSFGIAKRIARGVVGAVLARAQERYGVEIFSIVVMSNHLHLLVRTPKKNLAAFMRDFKAQVTSNMNLLFGRTGPLWARRFDAQPVLDDDAAFDRVLYTLDNPVKAGLVEDAEEWPGLIAARGFSDHELEFEYLDRTAWHRKRRPKDLEPFMKRVTLRLSKLPAMERRNEERIRKEISDALRARSAQACERRRVENRALVGLEGLGNTALNQRPKHPKRTRRPYCHASDPCLRDRHREKTRDLYQVYQSASARFRAGMRDVEFPEGTYAPPLLFAA